MASNTVSFPCLNKQENYLAKFTINKLQHSIMVNIKKNKLQLPLNLHVFDDHIKLCLSFETELIIQK